MTSARHTAAPVSGGPLGPTGRRTPSLLFLLPAQPGLPATWELCLSFTGLEGHLSLGPRLVMSRCGPHLRFLGDFPVSSCPAPHGRQWRNTFTRVHGVTDEATSLFQHALASQLGLLQLNTVRRAASRMAVNSSPLHRGWKSKA